MSVAFTREEDSESVAANLPDRPISPHANLVTPQGLAQLDAARASAKLMDMQPGTHKVVFGGSVSIEREDGRRQTFRIVGEDEADPAKGAVSYISPLAQAVLGKAVGDVADV